jgi:hypothetical protein
LLGDATRSHYARIDRLAAVGTTSRLPRDVRLLVVVQVLWGLGFGLIGPLQPLYLQTLGADPGQIGLVFGVGNIVGGLLVIPAGALADRRGRRLVIVASGVCGTIGAASLVLLDHWEWSFASSILYWAGTAALPVMSAHVSATAPRAVLGFRSESHAQAADLVPNAEVVVEPTYVTDVIPPNHDVLACGPEAMLAAVRGLEPAAQLAWEAPMACGYGACYGCAVEIDGELRRLCVDGPVLESRAA